MWLIVHLFLTAATADHKTAMYVNITYGLAGVVGLLIILIVSFACYKIYKRYVIIECNDVISDFISDFNMFTC